MTHLNKTERRRRARTAESRKAVAIGQLGAQTLRCACGVVYVLSPATAWSVAKLLRSGRYEVVLDTTTRFCSERCADRGVVDAKSRNKSRSLITYRVYGPTELAR